MAISSSIKESHSLDRQSHSTEPALICIAPNVHLLADVYSDFFDRQMSLSKRAVAECSQTAGIVIEHKVSQPLPYTIAGKRQPFPFLVRLQLDLPILWPLVDKLFLVVGCKPPERFRGAP